MMMLAMLECAGFGGLAIETLQHFLVAGKTFGDGFDGDFAIELAIEGAVDHAHAAATEEIDHFVLADAFDGRSGHRFLCCEGKCLGPARYPEQCIASRFISPSVRECPQGLKPDVSGIDGGAAKAAPFQNSVTRLRQRPSKTCGDAEAAFFCAD